MNKAEKLICLVLGAVLAWYVFNETGRQKKAPAEANSTAVTTNAVVKGESPSPALVSEAKNKDVSSVKSGEDAASPLKKLTLPSVPEKTVTLENDDVKLELSTWGAVVKKVTLKKYAKDCGGISEENPSVVLDFTEAPMGAIGGVEGLAENAAYEVRSQSASEVVFANALLERKVTLRSDYQIAYEDAFAAGVGTASGQQQATPLTFSLQPSTLSLGSMRMGDSKNDLLSVDSWAMDAGKGKPGVIHHGDDDSPLKAYLVGGLSGGCSGSKSAAGMPETTMVEYPGAQTWIAVKNRFFVTALVSCTEANQGFVTTVRRAMNAVNYKPESVSAAVKFGEPTVRVRTMTFFVGPKKQALLWDLGMKDVMEFGMWRWLCYPLVWVLNLFNGWIPNFGIAIILLTILVRVLFWPLTHKSTVGMKKMQEIQPLMKEIQTKYKDNPQRLQQETWALYKEKKVNPMSSCLPMLIQIPVFIALFNVLRSAVELRYAPFLWISDLSEPEALFASWFPFGGLNLLPIAMAVTTALQSYFTPSGGDRKQQQMMMIMMPAMMLVMFYSFPSALSLYWFLSNIFSIVQMWLIRRSTAQKTEALTPEVIDPPQTRQMKRHA